MLSNVESKDPAPAAVRAETRVRKYQGCTWLFALATGRPGYCGSIQAVVDRRGLSATGKYMVVPQFLGHASPTGCVTVAILAKQLPANFDA